MQIIFQSKSRPDIKYTTTVAEDGKLLCNCPGWTNRRGEAARHCTHTKSVAVGKSVQVRGEFVYLTAGGKDAPPTLAPMAAMAVNGAPLPPMLASAVPDLETGAAFDARYATGWRLEEKFDGHRVQVVVGSTIRAYSRPRAGGEAKARELPADIAAAFARLLPGIYDGELCAPGGKSSDVVVRGAALVYYLFDVLEIEGHSWRNESYEYRRAGLELLPVSDPIRLSESHVPTWAAVQHIWARGGEGAILKSQTSKYHPGVRSPHWLKIKRIAAAELEVIGFEAGKLGPYSALKLRDAEGVETTVKTKNNQLLRDIAANPKSYLGRKLIVSYQERYNSGKYRHPMFDHFLK